MTEAGSERELVRRTARLARLQLGAEVEADLARDFARTLAHFRAISEVDVEGVEPMTGPGRPAGVLRPDEPRPGLSRERLMREAPDSREGFYGVPKTVHRPGGGSP